MQVVDALGARLLGLAGQVTVADGSDAMARRIERVLTGDPGIGIARHADAGYEQAIQFAEDKGVKSPLVKPSGI